MYGTAFNGGVDGAGTALILGSSLRPICRLVFSSAERLDRMRSSRRAAGDIPMARIRSGASGRLWAAAMLLAFILPPAGARAGSFEVLYAFKNSPDGAWPRSNLIE